MLLNTHRTYGSFLLWSLYELKSHGIWYVFMFIIEAVSIQKNGTSSNIRQEFSVTWAFRAASNWQFCWSKHLNRDVCDALFWVRVPQSSGALQAFILFHPHTLGNSGEAMMEDRLYAFKDCIISSPHIYAIPCLVFLAVLYGFHFCFHVHFQGDTKWIRSTVVIVSGDPLACSQYCQRKSMSQLPVAV